MIAAVFGPGGGDTDPDIVTDWLPLYEAAPVWRLIE